jgi:hypothetical protein
LRTSRHHVKRSALTALVAGGALTAVLAIAHARAATAYTAPDIQTTTRDHMQMTLHAPQQPGDSARADAIVAAARKVMAQYPTVEAAENAGFKKFLPKIPLPIEHYTNRSYAVEAYIGEFDPMHPTSLIFKRSGDTLQIVGVMYTASNSADREVLDSRVPLSYGTWHRHVDFCKAPAGTPLAERAWVPARASASKARSKQKTPARRRAARSFRSFSVGWYTFGRTKRPARESGPWTLTTA